MKRPPLILGGQGRTSRAIRRDASTLAWMLAIAVILVTLAILRRVSQ